MNKYPIIIILFFSFTCKKNTPQVLEGLSKNYILNKKYYNNPTEFYDEYKINEANFLNDSIKYHQAIEGFINSKTEIISILLKYENSDKFYYWIKTPSPYSSTIKKYELINASESAKILIDNYIFKRDSIIIPHYINNIKYSWLKKWFNKNKSRNQLELEYSEYVKNMNS